eukprot:1794815-Rhodomonas_salina.1
MTSEASPCPCYPAPGLRGHVTALSDKMAAGGQVGSEARGASLQRGSPLRHPSLRQPRLTVESSGHGKAKGQSRDEGLTVIPSASEASPGV